MGGESETSDGAVLATLHARGRARFRRDRGKQGGNEDLLFNGGEVLERAAAHSTETAKPFREASSSSAARPAKSSVLIYGIT